MPYFRGIYYSLYGTQNNPPVFFLHGFLGSGREWEKVISLLKDNYLCITLDLPGHGKSINLKALSKIWDFDAISQTLDNLVRQLGFQKISLVSYSLGGRIALHWIQKYPEKIGKLALESTNPGIKDKTEKSLRIKEDEKLAAKLIEDPLPVFLKKWYTLPLFKGIKKHPDFNGLLKERLKNNPHLLARALQSYSTGKQQYFGTVFKTLCIPVLLICGELDVKYLPIITRMKMYNKNFNLKIIKNTSHNTHFENPNLFAEHLTEFLSL